MPTTDSSKLFLAFYSPLAVVTFARVLGALALRPLNSARRLAQRKVLQRYGGTLTKQKLTQLAAGPLVKRLGELPPRRSPRPSPRPPPRPPTLRRGRMYSERSYESRRVCPLRNVRRPLGE